MRLTRRGLFKLGAGVAAGTVVGVPAHEHDHKGDITRLGYVCECGDFLPAAEMRLWAPMPTHTVRRRTYSFTDGAWRRSDAT